ncbi:unnamed protein product [Closterium sp. NIES-54]
MSLKFMALTVEVVEVAEAACCRVVAVPTVAKGPTAAEDPSAETDVAPAIAAVPLAAAVLAVADVAVTTAAALPLLHQGQLLLSVGQQAQYHLPCRLLQAHYYRRHHRHYHPHLHHRHHYRQITFPPSFTFLAPFLPTRGKNNFILLRYKHRSSGKRRSEVAEGTERRLLFRRESSVKKIDHKLTEVLQKKHVTDRGEAVREASD